MGSHSPCEEFNRREKAVVLAGTVFSGALGRFLLVLVAGCVASAAGVV